MPEPTKEEVKVTPAPPAGATTETKVVVETVPAPFPAPPGTVEQKITITQSTRAQEFGRWTAGLLAGFIGGGAHALASGSAFQYVDPVATHEALVRYGWLYVFHGIISAGIYLKNHPIPDEWNPALAGTDKDRRRSERP